MIKENHHILKITPMLSVSIFVSSLCMYDSKMASTITSLWSFILLSYLCSISPSISALPFGNESDKLSLLAIKDRIIEDPLNVMTKWNQSLHHCDWLGVSCSRRHPGRVTVLNLEGKKLTGSLPPHVGNLTFLRGINLRNNTFIGEIPQEVSRLIRLKHLNLSRNGFQGEIPKNLSNCPDLQVIDLNYNSLTGEIPAELSFLRLTALYIYRNSITGTIPQWLGNASLLIGLSMGYNNLQGTIPPELGRLSKLRLLQLSVNNLSGTIPPTICNLSSLIELDVGLNQLHGEIPSDIGFSLRNLKGLYVSENQLSGQLPVSLPNASKLEILSFSKNHFHDAVPLNLGSLGDIVGIGLGYNELETVGFLTALTNCTNLRFLDVGNNRFKGKFPVSITNLSTRLELLSLAQNQISGTIPEGIDNLVSMTQLGLNGNYISEEIPSSIGNLGRLGVLWLAQNRLSGAIPSSLGNISRLSRLLLFENNLQGTIPPSLGNCHDLEILDLSDNLLTGTIPKEVVSISSMTLLFNLSNNSLTGPLPPEVGNMSKLMNLDISRNRLSGEIPITLANCIMLNNLRLQNNLFQGNFAPSLSTLRSLEILDFSNNNLSGKIPVFLQNFTFLKYLDLSFNKLEGEVPLGGVFSNLSAFSIVGNKNLCGGIEGLGLPKCEVAVRKKKGLPLAQKVAIPVAISCLLLLASLFGVLFWTKKTSKKRSTMLPVDEQFQRVSYTDLLRATDGFSLSNLIGEGRYGSVYRGILGTDGTIVAVKVLNLKQKGAAKSFTAECNALKIIRHRNLIRIITSCSSIDPKGEDFKALVYEYMPNGSLEEWLHQSEDRELDLGNLSLAQRLSIAIDVASALEYLHHHCQSSIIHGDLKPSNVLLDNDINARVGDFGLARFLGDSQHDDSSQSQTSSTWIKGTVGYVAPEYGMGGKGSMQGDIYSFGVLLLEIFTGRRPTEHMFEGSLTLHTFTKMALPERVTEIVDPSLLLEIRGTSKDIQNQGNSTAVRAEIECLVSVLRIGVSCSMELPGERMDMRNVVAELCIIRRKLLNTKI